MIRNIIASLFRRKNVPTNIGSAPSSTVQPVPTANSKPSGTRHQETNTYVMTNVINGQIPGNIETRELNGCGVTVKRVHPKVLTARSTLADADKILGVCEWCGLPIDTPPESCDLCSMSLCTKDISCIVTPSGILQGCPDCIARVLRNWNHWQNGNPPTPFSITKLNRKGS